MKEIASPAMMAFTPIGVIRTRMRLKFDAPHQPANSRDEESVIELHGGQNFEKALKDLAGFDRIWLIWWFHKNATWRPMVLPPRGPGVRRGVFATRSPHRPNPIGITAVPLLKIVGRKIYVGNNDLLDGTPVLDIKPYVATADAFPDASLGWIADVDAALAGPANYSVQLEALAKAQTEWLQSSWELDFMPRAKEILSRDPTPHRTRRISRLKNGSFRLGCGAWRVYFVVQGSQVKIERLSPGYPLRLLNSPDSDVAFREAQLAFLAKWPE
jgi:tRNA-Thr(GGU) m(6)t(6)A37 methyltransferase TsaA